MEFHVMAKQVNTFIMLNNHLLYTVRLYIKSNGLSTLPLLKVFSLPHLT